MDCIYFIPKVTGQQAYRFIGKNHMRFAAGGAPAAVKRRAENRSTKVRTSIQKGSISSTGMQSNPPILRTSGPKPVAKNPPCSIQAVTFQIRYSLGQYLLWPPELVHKNVKCRVLTSFSEYSDLATMSSSIRVSAWNSCLSLEPVSVNLGQ